MKRPEASGGAARTPALSRSCCWGVGGPPSRRGQGWCRHGRLLGAGWRARPARSWSGRMAAVTAGCELPHRRPPPVWACPAAGGRARRCAAITAAPSGRLWTTSGHERPRSTSTLRACAASPSAARLCGDPGPGEQRTAHHRSANARGTVHAAGWASSAPVQPSKGPASMVAVTAALALTPPARRPAIAPNAVRPPPPDPEDEQGAERGRSEREREPHRVGQPDLVVSRRAAAARRRPPRWRANVCTDARSRGGPAAARAARCRGPQHPATETISPEAVDRNAAKAPATSSDDSRSPQGPRQQARRQQPARRRRSARSAAGPGA